MARKTNFGQKLKALRTAHQLRHEDLSRYTTILNESSISTASFSWWENDKRVASIESALLLADVFGVSMNWLISSPDEKFDIYDESRLEALEQRFLSRKNKIVIRGTAYPYPFYEQFPEEYLDLATRKKVYSMEARANIIFLIYVIDFEWERYIKFNTKEFKQEPMTLKDYGWLGLDWYMSSRPDEDAMKHYNAKLLNVLETKKPVYHVIL